MEKDKEKSNVRKGYSECNEYRQTDKQTNGQAHIDTVTNTFIAALHSYSCSHYCRSYPCI